LFAVQVPRDPLAAVVQKRDVACKAVRVSRDVDAEGPRQLARVRQTAALRAFANARGEGGNVRALRRCRVSETHGFFGWLGVERRRPGQERQERG
jgi:hypothetical protein